MFALYLGGEIEHKAFHGVVSIMDTLDALRESCRHGQQAEQDTDTDVDSGELTSPLRPY